MEKENVESSSNRVFSGTKVPDLLAWIILMLVIILLGCAFLVFSHNVDEVRRDALSVPNCD